MNEETVLFGGRKSLVGIVTTPPDGGMNNSFPGIVLLNAGMVHRVGLNRLHVNIARCLAAAGFVVLRFDFSGIGDSGPPEDDLPYFERGVIETRRALDYLSESRSVKKFVLIGICSGAVFSFKAACSDQRVSGAILINARDYLHGSDERLKSYLRNRSLSRHYIRMAFFSSFSAKNWWKAFTGKVNYGSVIGLIQNLPLRNLLAIRRKTALRENVGATALRSLADRGVHLFLIHCEGDEGLDYLHMAVGKELQELIAARKLRLEIIPGANHIFTLLWSQKSLVKLLKDWVQELARL
jgi:pimeloyl-ACP methyl ester carboxylesterase